jgi:hypothetical protein
MLTDRHDEADSRFRNVANAPKNGIKKKAPCVRLYYVFFFDEKLPKFAKIAVPSFSKVSGPGKCLCLSVLIIAQVCRLSGLLDCHGGQIMALKNAGNYPVHDTASCHRTLEFECEKS